MAADGKHLSTHNQTCLKFKLQKELVPAACIHPHGPVISKLSWMGHAYVRTSDTNFILFYLFVISNLNLNVLFQKVLEFLCQAGNLSAGSDIFF